MLEPFEDLRHARILFPSQGQEQNGETEREWTANDKWYQRDNARDSGYQADDERSADRQAPVPAETLARFPHELAVRRALFRARCSLGRFVCGNPPLNGHRLRHGRWRLCRGGRRLCGGGGRL